MTMKQRDEWFEHEQELPGEVLESPVQEDREDQIAHFITGGNDALRHLEC